MRVLIDPGSHHLLNAGDVAMLQVCVERLRRLVPAVEIAVLTTDPEALAALCPGVVPIDAAGRYELVDAAEAPGEPAPSAPHRRRGAAWLREAAARRAVRPRDAARLEDDSRLRGATHPQDAARLRGAIRRAALRRQARRAGPAATAYLGAMLDADLFLMSGRGGVTDAFAGEARATLGELELARAAGVPAALLGHGLGPLDDRALRARTAAVLPSLTLVSVREGVRAPALLAAAGVSPRRVHVTGDDAVEPAHAARPASLGDAVGVNVRAADYAGIDRAAARGLVAAVGEAAAALGAATVAVPISVHPSEDDRVTVGDLGAADAEGSAAGAGELAGPAGAADGEQAAGAAGSRAAAPAPAGDPTSAIAAAGRCQVVVTGSYHAAVFALAQGVPAVGVAASPYYLAKFEGLRERFGPGVTVVPDPAPATVRTALERLWEAAPTLRPALLAAAARQIDAAWGAYRALASEYGGSGPTTGSGSRGPDALGG